MSKYPVKYRSASKGVDIDIETMATPHIIHAWRKLLHEHRPVELNSMAQELRARGCTYDGDTGRWVIPQETP